MHVDQRQVTAISLRDGRERACMLARDGAGYRLSLVSKDDVVNIFLSASDLSGLRRELAGGEGCEGCKESREVAEAKNGWKVHEPFSCATAAESAHCTWANGDWLSYN